MSPADLECLEVIPDPIAAAALKRRHEMSYAHESRARAFCSGDFFPPTHGLLSMSKHGKHALMTTAEHLRERCKVDPVTHCWEWTGAHTGTTGMPAIHVFDHERGEKRTMSGPRAAWSLAFGEAPPTGELIFRGCCNNLCLNPAHLRRAKTQAEIGLHQRRAGSRKGTAMESRRENISKAWAAAGITVTSLSVVQQIRQADAAVTGKALAAQFGLAMSTVSKIRRGESHKGVA